MGKILIVRRVENGFLLTDKEPEIDEVRVAETYESLCRVVKNWACGYKADE